MLYVQESHTINSLHARELRVPLSKKNNKALVTGMILFFLKSFPCSFQYVRKV